MVENAFEILASFSVFKVIIDYCSLRIDTLANCITIIIFLYWLHQALTGLLVEGAVNGAQPELCSNDILLAFYPSAFGA